MNLDAADMIRLYSPPECAVCGSTECLSVDHDHSCCPGARSCGKCIRGLLCRGCNTALGLTREDAGRLRRLAEYADQNPRFAREHEYTLIYKKRGEWRREDGSYALTEKPYTTAALEEDRRRVERGLKPIPRSMGQKELAEWLKLQGRSLGDFSLSDLPAT